MIKIVCNYQQTDKCNVISHAIKIDFNRDFSVPTQKGQNQSSIKSKVINSCRIECRSKKAFSRSFDFEICLNLRVGIMRKGNSIVNLPIIFTVTPSHLYDTAVCFGMPCGRCHRHLMIFIRSHSTQPLISERYFANGITLQDDATIDRKQPRTTVIRYHFCIAYQP